MITLGRYLSKCNFQADFGVSSLGFDLRAFVPQGLNGNPNYFGFWDNFLNLIICESLKAGGLACVTLAWSSPWKCSTFAKICVVWGQKCLEKRWTHPEIYGILYKTLNWLFNQFSALLSCQYEVLHFLRVEERTLGTRLARSLFPLSHEPSLILGTCEDQDGGPIEVRWDFVNARVAMPVLNNAWSRLVLTILANVIGNLARLYSPYKITASCLEFEARVVPN